MIESLIGPVAGLLDKFIEDKDQKNALAHQIDTSTMMPVLLGMLGLGAMRSAEKIKKVSREK